MVHVVVGRLVLAAAVASAHGTRPERVPDYIVDLLRYHVRVGIEIGILSMDFKDSQSHIDLHSASRILSAAHRQRTPRNFRSFAEDSETVRNFAARINYLIDKSVVSVACEAAAPPA